ncbi:MAG: alpha-amylase family glycosyl hydrolase [Myxococcaceae bacterium]
MQTLQRRDLRLTQALEKIDPNWMHTSAWAYEYPRHFDDLRAMLPLYEKQGVRVIELLPHLKHGGVDGGYDIINLAQVAKEYGGNAAFKRFVNDAAERGIVVVTDLVPNHVSDKHIQFRRLLRHDEAAAKWFHDMSDAKKFGSFVREEDSLVRLKMQHGDGENAPVSTPWHVFSQASENNLLSVNLKGQWKQFWHTFYPQQPDLNLKHPPAWRYLVDSMGWSSNQGVMGTRLDAVPHVAKEKGTDFEDIPQTFAFEAALAAYWRLVQPKGVILPEVGKPFDAAARHFGEARTLHGVTRNTQGDILFGFDLQAAYRSSLLTEDPEFLHAMNGELAGLPGNTQFALWLGGHHDELRWDLIARLLKGRGYSEEAVAAIQQRLVDAGGKQFAERGYGIRHATMRNGDEHAIAGDFVTGMGGTDAIPLMYEGDELAMRNSQETMDKATAARGGVEDTRDLQRERRTAADVEARLAEGAEPITVFSALNALRATHPAMRAKVQKLAAGENVFAVARKPEEGEGVAVIRNLSNSRKTARLSLEALREQLGWTDLRPEQLEDILQAQMGEPSSLPLRIEDGHLTWTMGPHDYAVLGRSRSGEEPVSWSAL